MDLMTSSERIPVTPGVLIWARNSISLDEAAASKRLGISEATLRKWEAGELNPTITQLRSMADRYKRPLGVLLLSEPPTSFDAMRDFRRQGLYNAPWSPDLHGEFRRALDQREVFLELAEISPESVPSVEEPPRIAQTQDGEAASRVLRSYLGISIQQQVRWSDPYEALNAWTDAIEAKGIIVIHTKGVSVDEMRGFSVSEWPFPVIALNGADFPRGRTFSLLHELVHISINLGGLCDLHENRGRSEGDELEHQCNQVAAATLMPADVLLDLPPVSNATSHYSWTLDELSVISKRFQVSSEALLLRLISIGKASWSTYNSRRDEFRREYDSAIEHRRLQRLEGRGGANYYRTKARDLGHSYANTVVDAFSSRAISARDAADFLGIKYSQLGSLQAELR